MAQDFAKKNKNFPKVTSVTKKEKNTKTKKEGGSSKKFLIFFLTLSIIITCILVIYIQNGMNFKLEVAKKENEFSINPKFEFYKILPNMQLKLLDETNKTKISSETPKKQILIQKSISISTDTAKVHDLNPPAKNLIKKESIENNSSQALKTVDSKNNKDKTNPQISSNAENSNNIKKVNYLLQLASFKDYKDADNLRAKLILSGIDVDIYNAKLNNNTTWYRVRSKKTNDYQNVTKLKDKLLAFGIKAIILKDIG